MKSLKLLLGLLIVYGTLFGVAYVWNEMLPVGWDDMRGTHWWEFPTSVALVGLWTVGVVGGLSIIITTLIPKD